VGSVRVFGLAEACTRRAFNVSLWNRSRYIWVFKTEMDAKVRAFCTDLGIYRTQIRFWLVVGSFDIA
jgi:hypothetical protein